jgi:hypothetical protein
MAQADAQACVALKNFNVRMYVQHTVRALSRGGRLTMSQEEQVKEAHVRKAERLLRSPARDICVCVCVCVCVCASDGIVWWRYRSVGIDRTCSSSRVSSPPPGVEIISDGQHYGRVQKNHASEG